MLPFSTICRLSPIFTVYHFYTQIIRLRADTAPIQTIRVLGIATMKLADISMMKKLKPTRAMFLEVAQSLGLLVAAQLLVNGLLISFLREELILLPRLSSSGLLNIAFLIIVLCSVLSIVRNNKIPFHTHGS